MDAQGTFRIKRRFKASEKNAKKKYVPDQLKTIRHTGSVFRKKSVTGDDYLKAFTFHGGEFGNWLNDNDRQYSLDYGYDAFTILR